MLMQSVECGLSIVIIVNVDDDIYTLFSKRWGQNEPRDLFLLAFYHIQTCKAVRND